MGDICFAGGNVKFNQSGENNYTQARETIPVGYRPAETSNVPIAVFGGNTLYASIGVLGSILSLALFHLGHPQAAPGTRARRSRGTR